MFSILFVELLHIGHLQHPNPHDTSAATLPLRVLLMLPSNVGISAIGLSLVTFFGIKKNIVVQACCGHLPLCSTFSRTSTISPLVSFVKSWGTFGWKPSHPTPVFALYDLDTLSNHTLYEPWQCFLRSLQFRIFPRLVLHFLPVFVTLPVPCPILSSLLHSGSTAWHPLLVSSGSVLLHSMLWAS